MAFEHLNKTGVLWLMNKIKSSLNKKVDKIPNKGLSENDFTTVLKTKYDEAATKVEDLITTGGEPNKINTISVNGKALVPDEQKKVEITVPTTQGIASQIEAYNYQNKQQVDSAITSKGYQTAAQVDSAIVGKGYQTAPQVQSAIASALSGVTSIDLQVVQSLPSTGKKGVIYLVPHTHTDGRDLHDEFVWVEGQNKFEKIGNTDIDLSAYVKSADIKDITEQELTTLWNS